MKIRIKGNSMRLRLSRTEVERFGKEGYLEESTDFGSSSFIYALRNSGAAKEMSADFRDGKMTMNVPAPIVQEWTATDKVGYTHNMDTGAGNHLFLQLEKDFKCIDADDTEDQSDNYEHPLLKCE